MNSNGGRLVRLYLLIFLVNHDKPAPMLSFSRLRAKPFALAASLFLATALQAEPTSPFGSVQKSLYGVSVSEETIASLKNNSWGPSDCVPAAFFTSLQLSQYEGKISPSAPLLIKQCHAVQTNANGMSAESFQEVMLRYLEQFPDLKRKGLDQFSLVHTNSEDEIEFLERIHGILLKTLKNGFVPSLGLYAEAGYPSNSQEKYFLKVVGGHQVNVSRVQEVLNPDDRSFEIEILDSGNGKKFSATLQIERRAFSAYQFPIAPGESAVWYRDRPFLTVISPQLQFMNPLVGHERLIIYAHDLIGIK